MNNMFPAIKLTNISKSFRQGDKQLDILCALDLVLMRGERVALVGPSGAGKSTLLHIAGLLERPDQGTIMIGDIVATQASDAVRTKLRRQSIGYVYQMHHLLPEFSARENIILPQMIAGVAERDAGKRADELLELVGLQARGDHRPAKLSGGEQQRVAIARALANRPSLVIADEPTGNLDPATAAQIFTLLQNLAVEQKVALLMATHNQELAASMDRIVTLRQGRLE
jgi:lipoprotein-releasing system ATP-binding protein